MRKGADSFGRPTGGYTSRGVRHPRRRDAVWLVTGAAPNPALRGQLHHTAGALALGSATSEQKVEIGIHRCALVIERDPALAEALAHTLQERLETKWSVRRISDIRLLSSTPQSSAPEIIVLDANWPINSGTDSYQRLSELFDSHDAQMMFITSNTSYQLSQRGITKGVVLREWRHLDDIVMLVAEALVDDQACD